MNSRFRSSVSRLQTMWLLTLPWPPSDQHTALTGTKAEAALIRKQISTPSSNEIWLDTTGVTNGNGLESVECKLQGSLLRSAL
ncbi:hypothetical protein TNCV_763531 [Trichonephila clavipes]|nr:hypothetical protein TNCV_763531 [Trichonephila clavipes]